MLAHGAFAFPGQGPDFLVAEPLQQGKPSKYWALAVLLNALLFGSAFLAVQTGNKDEDRVEKILASEDPLETHEEKAEFFLKLAGAALALAALGFAPGALGLTGRVLGASASLILLAAGMQVGHSGGQLVYQHGAATAFTMDRAAGSEGGADPARRDRKGGDKDED